MTKNMADTRTDLAKLVAEGSLPGGYEWGIALSSRHRIRPPQHLMYPGDGVQMVCSGGRGLVENSGGKYCPACVAWLKELRETYGDSDE